MESNRQKGKKARGGGESDGEDQPPSSDEDDDRGGEGPASGAAGATVEVPSVAQLVEQIVSPRESGVGILEFSPEKAGMDVTPANYEFAGPAPVPPREKRHSGTFSTIAGNCEKNIYPYISKMRPYFNYSFCCHVL